MEKDTVILNLEEYNNLRDFKKNIEQDKVFVVYFAWGGSRTYFVTENEAFGDMLEENRRLQKENLDLKNANLPKAITIDDIKKMTYWQFRKWRKSITK